MYQITIGIILIALIIDVGLSILNYSYRNKPIPKNVADVYDKAEYSKWLGYTMESTRLSIISKITGRLILVSLLVFGVFPLFKDISAGLTSDKIFQSLVFLGLYGIVSYVSSIFFTLYRTFVIEEKYGFNTTTLPVFLMDQVKSIVLSALLGGFLFYVILSLYDKLGQASLVYSWLILMSISLLINLLYTKVFVQLFNKLTPITEGRLYDEAKALAEKTGYEITKISVMDASKRSTKLNAYFSGFGKFKQIILYDTLVEKCSTDEIISILAHEIGHAKHKDVLKNFFVLAVQSGAMLYVLSFFLTSASLSAAFGFESPHYGFAFILFSIMMEPVSIVLGIPMSAFSRRAEYRADAFATDMTEKSPMIKALKVLAKENYSNLTPHPLVVAMTYSHPPISARIDALDH